jgi:hypothetical protein
MYLVAPKALSKCQFSQSWAYLQVWVPVLRFFMAPAAANVLLVACAESREFAFVENKFCH